MRSARRRFYALSQVVHVYRCADLLRSSSRSVNPLSQLYEQIPNDHGVHKQHHHASDRDPPRDFVKLQRYQRARDDYRKVLGPALLQPQARSFSQKQRGVKERSDAKLFELAIVHHAELGDQCVNEAIVRINPDLSDPIRCKFRDVSVKQPDCPNSNREKQQTFEEFEDGNYSESLAISLVSGMSSANWFRHLDL